MKTTTEIIKKQIQYVNDSNKLTRGRNMKYFLILSTILVTGIFAQNVNPETGWEYNQSTLQAFYMLTTLTIDGEVAEGDGTGAPPNDGACLTSGGCDVVGSFVERDGVEVCVGWVYADASTNVTTVPLMGNDGTESAEDYLGNGESAYLKVYDASNGSILSVIPGDVLPGWSNNGINIIEGTSTANNTFGCTDASACNYSEDATANDGSCAAIDCAGECGGSSQEDDCGVCDGGNADDLGCGCFVPGPSGCDDACGSTLEFDECGVCDGSDYGCENPENECSCSGCTNSDANADSYDSSATVNDGSCVFTVSAVDDLSATPYPNKISLSWTQPEDTFANDNGNYSYDIYVSGSLHSNVISESTTIYELTPGVEYSFYVVSQHEYGTSAASNEVTASPLAPTGAPTWRLQLVAEIDSWDQFANTTNPEWLLEDTENYLGAATDGTWGYDEDHDIPEPTPNPGNYISLFFDHPEWETFWGTHFTEDIVQDNDDFFKHNLTQWDGTVKSNVQGSASITFSVETSPIPDDCEMYVELDGNYTRIERETTTTVSFYMDGSGQKDFSVFIGNIVPQSPDNLEATGHYSSITLDWDEDDISDLSDIGNRYPANTYNVYRDDQPSDPNLNSSVFGPGDGPDGCGGLLTDAEFGQPNSDYDDYEDLYTAYPDEGLLQESRYCYTVTGSNEAGESSHGHTVKMSGGYGTFHAGRDSRDCATTGDNYDPYVILENVESSDDDYDQAINESGSYRIPHNYSPDANKINISIDGSLSGDNDYPDSIDNYLWTLVSSDNGAGGLAAIDDHTGTTTDAVSFTVSNPHENGQASYEWQLYVDTSHPVRVDDDDIDYNTCNGSWTSAPSLHSDSSTVTVTIDEEPNADPVASSSLGLIRAGDGNSVVTSNDYDDSDFNDYDGNPGNPDDDTDASGDQVWYEPHDNMGGENPADLWFSADQSDDTDGECESADQAACDHQTYVWTGIMATDIGFDFTDLNGDGQYNYGEPFSLLGNEATTFEDIDLGDYYAAGGESGSLNSPEDLENCSNCVSAQYSTSVNEENGLSTLADCEDEDGNWTGNCGGFNYNGRDAHISMYGGDDSIVILTMTVTDIYGDSDQTSLIISVEEERNEGPSVGQHRQQGRDDEGIYYMRTDEDTRDVYIGDQDAADYIDCDDLWADDNDNDTQIYTWEYDGPGAYYTDGDVIDDCGEFYSSYTHDREDNVRDNHGWRDVEAWLVEGDHTFTFTTEDPYGESASSSTTFKIADEPGAPQPSINVDHTGLRYAVISVWDNAWEDDDFADDECHGDVWHGKDNYPLYNTSEIALENGGNEIARWIDDDNNGSNTWTHVDESLNDETNYTYTVKAWNSELDSQMDAVLENSELTKTHDRPDVLVLSPNGAEIRSVNDENEGFGTVNDDFNVDFVTYFDDNDNGEYDEGEETGGQYISHIDVSYMPDGSSAEEGVNSAGELVSTHNGGNSNGCSNSGGDSTNDGTAEATNCHQGDTTLQYYIADNDKNGVDVNYNAKVRVCVTDVGDYNGDGFETYCDDSDNPFTMASHTLHHDFDAGWHLFGPALEIYQQELDLVNHLEAPYNMGNWGNDWVAYDVNGTYDGLTLNLGEGYYLAVAEGATMEVRGNPVIGDPVGSGGDLSLAKGWNLIANPLVNKVSKETLTINDGSGDKGFEDAVDAGWIAPTIFGLFEGGYSSIDRLMPFGGYWINTSRSLTVKVRPHLFPDGELTRKAEDLAFKLDLRVRDIARDGFSDFVSVGLADNADNDFAWGEDEYDLPRQAYTSMGSEYIDLKIGTNLMKDIRSTEYEDFHFWNISIDREKADNAIELSWGEIVGLEDALHLIINGEAINMHEEQIIMINSMIEEVVIVVGNVDSYLNPTPEEFELSAAYPNPFNPTTTLGLALDVDGFVSMSVFNIRGQVVEVLVDRNMKAGYHNVAWNADGVSSGMYFVRVETGANTAMQKLMLLK